MSFARFLKRERVKRGWTRGQLALRMRDTDGRANSGITERYIYKMETERRGPPSANVLVRVARALDMPFELVLIKAGVVTTKNPLFDHHTAPAKIAKSMRVLLHTQNIFPLVQEKLALLEKSDLVEAYRLFHKIMDTINGPED